nr:hypothetical protein [Treponema sp.]
KAYAHEKGRFPEWESVAKGEEKPIAIQSIMHAVGISEKEIELLLFEQKFYEKEAALFYSN